MNSNNAKKPEVNSIIIIGDSLSAQHNFEKPFKYVYLLKPADLFKYIKLSILHRFAGLKNFPDGQFTNGSVWVRTFLTFLILHAYRESCQSAEKMSNDALDSTFPNAVKEKITYKYRSTLKKLRENKDKEMGEIWKGRPIESLCVNESAGGASAYNFKHFHSHHPLEMLKAVIMGFLLSNQKEQTQHALKEKKNFSSPIVYIWIGENDLITFPGLSLKQVEKSLRTYEKNIKQIRKRWSEAQIIIINLPNPIYAPRFTEEKNFSLNTSVTRCVAQFNTGLHAIAERHDHCRLLDMASEFETMRNNPAEYRLNPKLADKSCIETGTCPIIHRGHDTLAPATGPGYSDHEHPSADVHARIATDVILKDIEQRYHFESIPNKQILKNFNLFLKTDYHCIKDIKKNTISSSISTNNTRAENQRMQRG